MFPVRLRDNSGALMVGVECAPDQGKSRRQPLERNYPSVDEIERRECDKNPENDALC
jgi:hypothetical protein